MSKTTIEWTGETWNPTVGCVQISPGCANCYAKTLHDKRHKAFLAGKAMAPQYAQPFEVLQMIESRLDAPLRKKKPTTYFVNSVSDLFHEDVPDVFIDRVFAVMALAPRHTFQILTKRAARMRAYIARVEREAEAEEYSEERWLLVQQMNATSENDRFSELYDKAYESAPDAGGISIGWPLPNVWLGVSVENQHFADERIPQLLQTPAAIRFISAEPLLEPVDIGLSSATCSCCQRWSSRWVNVSRPVTADFPMVLLPQHAGRVVGPRIHRADSNQHGALSVNGLGLRPSEFDPLPSLDWVIVGGESGHGARPFDVAWARAIVAQCKAAGVACFVKQLGSKPVRDCRLCPGRKAHTFPSQCRMFGRDGHGQDGLLPVHLKDRKGGHPSEWHEDLRVRQMPEVR